ncbi:MAG: hypothetical protein ACKOPC_03800 [Methylocystis sp.]
MKRQKLLAKILIVASFSLASSTAFAGDAISDAFEDTFGHDKIPNAFESAFDGKEKKPAAKPQKVQPAKTAPET